MKEEFDKELRELSPLLAYLKKEQEGEAFKVPKFYFDNLADKVIVQAKEVEKAGTTFKKETPQYPSVFARLQDLVSSLFRPRLALAFGTGLVIALGAWFMLTSPKSKIGVDASSVAVTPPIKTEQSGNIVEPKSGELQSFIGDKTPIKEQNNALLSNNKPNISLSNTPISSQNTTRLGETTGQNALAEGGQLVHPESGLTEEELATYLEENTDEYDSDGSDN
jgi:hypothetical protein